MTIPGHVRIADITIRSFQPEDQESVRGLVMCGLGEHFDSIDPAMNPDLDDIAGSYGSAAFLVACRGERIVATGALVPRSGEVAEVVRMSVAADLRREGIGTMMLHELCGRARESGFRRVVLETTETWAEVIAFYERFGFRITHHQDGNAYFALDLK